MNAPALVRRPVLLVPWLLGASSVGTLLLYFYGVAELGRMTRLLLPAAAALAAFIVWARRGGRTELHDRVVGGLWAGAIATLAYDLARVPVAWSGVPVFKAISYFGTVIAGGIQPTLASEVLGWTYHLSNGVGFGLMYAVMVSRPRWWTAAVWGVTLEAAMLVTPYAEVFGYVISRQFIAVSMSAHVVYGTALWAALRYWLAGAAFGVARVRRPVSIGIAGALVPLGMVAIAADFHARHAAALPASPPAYLGPHLYVTWDVLEPDRLAAMWVLRRFVDPEARFHFVRPFTTTVHGRPFDTPEAEVRRSGTRSATEVLLEGHGPRQDSRIARLASVTHLYEITPWMLPANLDGPALGGALTVAGEGCEPPAVQPCAERALAWLDAWYAGAGNPE
jgi:hypothetical protein